MGFFLGHGFFPPDNLCEKQLQIVSKPHERQKGWDLASTCTHEPNSYMSFLVRGTVVEIIGNP